MPLSTIGTNQITDGAIAVADVADGSITTAKIADNAVTTAKVNPAQTDITSVGTLTSFRSTGIDDNADALAMTIESSENVLIGKTTSAGAFNTVGTELRATGVVQSTVDGGKCFDANRKSSDGDIIGLSKDGTGVGSIGVADSGDRIYLAGGGAEGIGIDNGSNAFVPTNASGAYADNHISLGRSDARWAGIYTSDGLFVGGTGSANQLDDYEEGTFTPVFVNVSAPTYSSQQGKYTKIGTAVHCTVSIDVSTGLDTSDGSTVAVSGLPFTAVANEQATNASLGRYINLLGSKATSVTNFRQAQTSILLLEGHDSGVAYNEINSGGFLQMAFTYRTT